MLFFELFPAFMAVVCIVVGVALVKMNLDAEGETAAEPDSPGDGRHTDTDVNGAAVIGFIAVVLSAPAAWAQTPAASTPRIEQEDARTAALSQPRPGTFPGGLRYLPVTRMNGTARIT